MKSTTINITKPAKKNQRVRVLDVLRGLSLISMVAYHAMYDLVVMFGFDAPWYLAKQGYIWQQSICWVFILVSGAAIGYSKNIWRRASVVIVCALIITATTYFVMPQQTVWFGVLHFIGLAMFITAFLRPLLQKIKPFIGALISFALFLFTKGVAEGYLGFFGKELISLPASLYKTKWAFILGFPSASFSSSDYFPLLPWLFLFWAGFFVWRMFKVKQGKAGNNPIEWLGRKSLIVYMLHQPIIYGVLWLLNKVGVV